MRYKRLLLSVSIALFILLGLMAGLRGVPEPVRADGTPDQKATILETDTYTLFNYDGGVGTQGGAGVNDSTFSISENSWDGWGWADDCDGTNSSYWESWAYFDYELPVGFVPDSAAAEATICVDGPAYPDCYGDPNYGSDDATCHLMFAIDGDLQSWTDYKTENYLPKVRELDTVTVADGSCSTLEGSASGGWTSESVNDARFLIWCDHGWHFWIDSEGSLDSASINGETIVEPSPTGCVPIESLILNGPITGSVGESLAYTTTLVPDDATEPITWTWGANGDNFIDDLAGDSAQITWWSSGTYTVSVTAENCGSGFGGDAMQVVVTGVTYTPPFTIPTPVAPTFPPDCECPDPEFAVWEVGNWINWLWCNLLCWLQYFKDWLYYLWQLLYAALLSIANTIIKWVWTPLQQLRMLLAKWFNQLIYTIRSTFGGTMAWLGNASDELVEWLNCTSLGLANFIQDFSDELASWLQGTSDNLASWLQGFSDNLSAWLQDTSDELASWLQGFSDNLASFIQGTSDNLSTWLQDTSDELTDFLNVSSVNIGDWFSSFSDELSTWLQDTSDELAAFIQGTSDNLASWLQGTSDNLASWLQDTSDYMSSLLQYTADFLVNVNGEIVDLLNHTSDELASWLQGTSDNLELWLQGTSDNLASFIQGTSDELTAWLDDSAGNITPWLNSVLRSVSYANLETGNWLQETSDNLASFIQEVSDELASFIQGTSDNLELWLQGTSDNLASWLQNTSDEMVELLNAAGGSMVRLLNPIVASISGVLGSIIDILMSALSDTVEYLGQMFDVIEFVVDLIGELIVGLKDALNSETEADLYETVPGLSAFWQGLDFFDEVVGSSPLMVLNVISLGIIAINLIFWTSGQVMDMMEDIARW